MVETFTGGQIAARLAPLRGAEAIFRRGIVARDLARLPGAPAGFSLEAAEATARAALRDSGASHALAVLVELDSDDGRDRVEFGGTIYLAIVGPAAAATRRARIIGGRDWVRLGAVEMGLDCLRRQLLGLPVAERIDFEQAEAKA